MTAVMKMTSFSMTFDPGHDNTGAGARPLASESNLLVQEASREVQTSSGACYSPGEAPVLSSAWQESQFVTCSGGTLQLDQSDVVLVIPQKRRGSEPTSRTTDLCSYFHRLGKCSTRLGSSRGYVHCQSHCRVQLGSVCTVPIPGPGFSPSQPRSG